MVSRTTRTTQQPWKITSVVPREQPQSHAQQAQQHPLQQVMVMQVSQHGICPCTSTRKHTADSVSSAMIFRISAAQPTCSPISPMKAVPSNSEAQTILSMQ